MAQSTSTLPLVILLFANKEKAAKVKAALNVAYRCSVYFDVESMAAALTEQKVDVVLCEQAFLDGEPAGYMANINQGAPQTRILIIGTEQPIAVQITALKQGARGYFNESLPLEKLTDAIQIILSGEVWIERHVVKGLIDEINTVPQVDESHRKAVKTLSPKEMEVAALVSHGATNKMIAKKMNITERTVKAHLTTIFQKMNLPDRLSLAIVFRDLR